MVSIVRVVAQNLCHATPHVPPRSLHPVCRLSRSTSSSNLHTELVVMRMPQPDQLRMRLKRGARR